jgi:hypothetical protein
MRRLALFEVGELPGRDAAFAFTARIFSILFPPK